MRWHLLTGEYPPACGGIGHYTEQLSAALRESGDAVDVWAPGHSLPDSFGAQSEQVLLEAWQRDPGIVLLQYVPNALGSNGANLRFCRWLLARRRDGVDVRTMFHEPYFYFSVRRPWRNALAAVQRVMAATLIKASGHVYYSSETWTRYLRAYGAPVDAITLPIPATVPGEAADAEVSRFRRQFAQPGGAVVGHFGTFGAHVASELLPVVIALLDRQPALNVALVGEHSDDFQRALGEKAPAAAARVHATGRLPLEGVAGALRACDLLAQPYPDGVTTRRTTTMAGLRNGIATVTTDGPLTERVWRRSGAAALAPAGDRNAVVATLERLLADPAARREQAERGSETYGRCFSMERTVAALRQSAASAAPVPR